MTELSPQLIEVEGTYYVSDGHPLFSVARSLGQTYIDAELVIPYIL